MEKYTGKVFSDKLRHIYIELPRFVKSQSDCESFFECWIYNLANMKQMQEISFKDRDAIFGRLEEVASRANLSKEERAQYEYERKVYNDYFNSIDTAKKEGHEHGRIEGLKEGRAEGRAEGLAEGRAEGLVEGEHRKNLENAARMKAKGFSLEDIVDITGLTIDEIEKL